VSRQRDKVRLYVVSALLAIALLAVTSKLFTIQIIDGKRYALRSREQVQKPRIVHAKRGSIYDRKGQQLAVSVPGRMAVSLDALGIEGKGQATLQRIYPMGDLAGPVLGYVGRDGYGLGGAEFTFDHFLRGEDGWEMVHRDGKQRTYRKIGLPGKAPKDGSDVYLTIDVALQKIVQSSLKQAVENLNARGAMAIVMDPRTGKILAMANEPSFNPNVTSSFTLAERRNACISQIFEPGSTFKTMTAAVALEEKMYGENDLIDGNNGVFEIHGEVIRDDVPQGMITFTRALAVSSNVGFAQIANGFRNDQFYRYSRDFGFGTRTGISLPGEEQGILHPVRSWSGRTRVTMSYGYEVSATFLQMMMAYAAVANGGVLLSPIICERVERRDGTIVETASVRPVRRVMSEENAARLRGMLLNAVEGGTGRRATIHGITVGGKTGTARKPEAGGYSRTRHWSSFIGFLPADSPTLLCGVVIDEPAGGLGGGAAAAPVFNKIISQALAHPEFEFSDRILMSRTAAARDDTEDRHDRIFERVSVTHQLDSIKIAFNVEDTVRIVPNVIGKDLRDAFNIMNAGGIPVYAIGSGVVQRQSIAPGAILKSEAVCTLTTR
jgi:cell division protein FtsI/penicillin-binding protein 2